MLARHDIERASMTVKEVSIGAFVSDMYRVHAMYHFSIEQLDWHVNKELLTVSGLVWLKAPCRV